MVGKYLTILIRGVLTCSQDVDTLFNYYEKVQVSHISEKKYFWNLPYRSFISTQVHSITAIDDFFLQTP